MNKDIPQNWTRCYNCGIQVMETTKYKDKDYCDHCFKKCMEYESDNIRLKYDIRNMDPRELTWYQATQRRHQEEQMYVQ